MYLLFLLPVFVSATYNVSYGSDTISIECNRFYESAKGTCSDAATYSWDGISDQYPFFEVKQSYMSNGLKGLRESCERACGDVHDCRGYSVSSASSILSGVLHCDIYLSCSTITTGTTDVFQRQAPYACLIKATSNDGVFKNYNDNSQPWTQNTRQLVVSVKPFQEVHFSVNGVVHGKEVAIRNFNTIADDYCTSEDDLDCLFLHSGVLGILLFVIFVGIVTTNVMLFVTKRNLIS